MVRSAIQPSRHVPLLVSLALLSAWTTRAHSQEYPNIYPTCLDQPLLPRHLSMRDGSGGTENLTSPSARWGRIPLFRMPTGFLNDPIGLDNDEDGAIWEEAAASAPGTFADIDGRLGLAMGADNPFFDFRAPGDPGGVGYYRVHTQYQLFADRFTYCSLGLQAFAPAGPESDGVANGPTVLSPNLALTHELEGGLAVHGFVGKRVAARPGWTDNLGRGVQCGLAIQGPLTDISRPTGPVVHLFVEALGSLGRLPDIPQTRSASWGIIPGLHWRLRESWWLSSGVVLPVGSTRYETGLLQITCSWRF